MVDNMFHNSITVRGDAEGGGGHLLDPAVALRMVRHAAACRALHLHEAHVQVREVDVRAARKDYPTANINSLSFCLLSMKGRVGWGLPSLRQLGSRQIRSGLRKKEARSLFWTK